jgi:hypothetical protein
MGLFEKVACVCLWAGLQGRTHESSHRNKRSNAIFLTPGLQFFFWLLMQVERREQLEFDHLFVMVMWF